MRDYWGYRSTVQVLATSGYSVLQINYRGSTGYGDAFLEETIGRDEEELEAYSPINHVASLKTPILVAHGKQDERAPFRHARLLRRALERHDKDYEWFVKTREAHGFYDNENRVEYLETVLKFLDGKLKD